MAIRPFQRIQTPPHSADADLRHWLQHLADAINGLPFSYFSTSNGPNESAVTAPTGFIGIEIGSSATTKFWAKTSSGTTGWRELRNA